MDGSFDRSFVVFVWMTFDSTSHGVRSSSHVCCYFVVFFGDDFALFMRMLRCMFFIYCFDVSMCF